MPSNVIQIANDSTLWDIEDNLSSLEQAMPVRINLPRRSKKNFFKDSWLTSLITNAAVKSGHLTIHDYTMDDLAGMQLRFSRSLVGVLSAYMAATIENNQRISVPIDVHEIIEQIAYDHFGLFEQKEGGGKSFTCLSFDTPAGDGAVNTARPMVLSAENKRDFIEQFLRIKRDKIDGAFGIKSQLSLFEATYELEESLASLIYELYENTNQHGRFDENRKLIKGIRSFNVKRHIATRQQGLEQADSFTPLVEYFNGFPPTGDLRFYEVSISDNGLGIIGKFLSSRPDYSNDPEFSSLDELEKLNAIVERSLSSKLFPGAGKGIRTALSIVRQLKGFLTLRTNNCWVYYDGRSQHQSLRLTPVNGDNKAIANIRGTYYNILLPVANP
jgi:hypothetical protein